MSVDAAPRSAVVAPAKARSTAAAIALAFGAVTLFSLMDVLVKWQGALFAVVQIVFFRSIFALVPIGWSVWRAGRWEALKPVDLTGHIVRSLVGVVAMVTVFTAYTSMKLSDAVSITFAAPLFATALSVPMLGEKVGPHRWGAVLAGFVGVLIIVRPGTSTFEPVALLALLGAACIGVTTIYVRKLTRTETTESIVFYFTMTTTVCAAAILPFYWETPGLLDFGMLTAIGILGGVAQLLRTRASKLADVAILVPFHYTALLWAMFFGYVIWREVPDVYTVVGAAIVAASGLYIVFRETRQSPRPKWMRWVLRPWH